MPIIFSIEGNIGSGKSTLVKLLKQNLIKVEMTKIYIFTRTGRRMEKCKNSLRRKYYRKIL